VYRREREAKKKALDVLHDEIDRIMNPSIMILPLSISIIKEDINNILSYLENLRKTGNKSKSKKNIRSSRGW
jgi:archaellum biogenesis ATPase FlaH